MTVNTNLTVLQKGDGGGAVVSLGGRERTKEATGEERNEPVDSYEKRGKRGEC